MKVEKHRHELDAKRQEPVSTSLDVDARVGEVIPVVPVEDELSTADVASSVGAGDTLDAQIRPGHFPDGVTTVVDTGRTARIASKGGLLPRGLPVIQIDDRLGRLLLSLLLAVLLWFYVTNLENPAQTTSFKGLNVEVRNIGENLRVINSIPTVDTTIQAPQNLMTNLRQNDLHPYIDLQGLDAGVHQVPVRIDTNGLQGNSVSAGVDPGQVQVQLEVQASMIFPPAVQLNGTPAMGYRTDPAQVVPGSVRATGAQDAVSRIKQIVVPVDIDAKASTQQGQRTPMALDADGKEITGLTFDPPTVQVTVPVKLLFNYKSVPVRVTLVGQPAPGLAPVVKWEPTNVTVCCSPSVLEGLQSLGTVPVGITGTTSRVVTTTELILPTNVELYPGQTRIISVTVEVEVLQSTLDIPVGPTVEGLPPGYSATTSPDRVSVTLAGTFNQLQGIKPSDVRAFVDVSGQESGTITLTLQTSAPKGVRVQKVTPDKLAVTLIPPTPVPPTPVPPTPVPPTQTATRIPTATSVPTSQPTSTVAVVAPPADTLTPVRTATALPTGVPPTKLPTASPAVAPPTPLPPTQVPPTLTSTLTPPPSSTATAPLPTATPIPRPAGDANPAP